jgi:hypothetical protein
VRRNELPLCAISGLMALQQATASSAITGYDFRTTVCHQSACVMNHTA